MGHMLYVFGSIRISQGQLPLVLELHKRTKYCGQGSFGLGHHKTGDGFFKVGWLRAQMGDMEEAESVPTTC